MGIKSQGGPMKLRLTSKIAKQKSIANSEYPMDEYKAVGIAEGFIESESEEEVIAAWQYLHDTGLAYSLQGWFGRRARQLLEEGVITDNK